MSNAFERVLAAFGIPIANLLTTVDPTATPTNQAATDAVAAGNAILTKIVGGQTIVPFTSSNGSWTTPVCTRMWAGVHNGGGKGDTGLQGQGTFAGGDGGLDGGYIWQELDLTGLTMGVSTLAVTVGAAASTAGALGGTSDIVASTGTLITGISGTSAILTIEGAYLTSSKPGSGGKGGQANSATPLGSAGLDGENSGAGVGGNGGAGRNNAGTATAGSAGVNGSSTAPMVGGSGGGGGGGAAGTTLSTFTGGAGGNGGFPGGGSGGGGAAARQQAFATSVGGLGGTPGNGLVVIVYQ